MFENVPYCDNSNAKDNSNKDPMIFSDKFNAQGQFKRPRKFYRASKTNKTSARLSYAIAHGHDCITLRCVFKDTNLNAQLSAQ